MQPVMMHAVSVLVHSGARCEAGKEALGGKGTSFFFSMSQQTKLVNEMKGIHSPKEGTA